GLGMKYHRKLRRDGHMPIVSRRLMQPGVILWGIWENVEGLVSVLADVLVFHGRRLAAEGDPEEIQRVGRGGLEHAFSLEAATRGLHFETKGPFDATDPRQAHGHVGIFAEELDRAVIATGLYPGVALEHEITALHHRADPQD